MVTLITARVFTYAILVSSMIFFGAAAITQYVGNPFESQAAQMLVLENNILLQQISELTPRVNRLELHMWQLHERANRLHMLLNSRMIVGDSVAYFSSSNFDISRQRRLVSDASIRP